MNKSKNQKDIILQSALLCAFCIIFIPARYADAQITSPAMQMSASARSWALADALVADAYDENTVYHNPAASSQLDFIALNYFYSFMPNDLRYMRINFLYPFKNKIKLTAGLDGSVNFMTDIPLYDEVGNPANTGRYLQINAAPVFGMFLFNKIGIGSALHWHHQRLLDYSSHGFSFDVFSYFPDILIQNLDLGISFRDIIGFSKRNTVNTNLDRMPMGVELGIKYRLLDDDLGLFSVLEYHRDWVNDDNAFKGKIAAEYLLLRHVALRVGVKVPDFDFTAGTGVNLYLRQTRISVDYAFERMANQFGNNHQVSLSFHLNPRDLKKAQEYRFKGEELFRAASYDEALRHWEMSLDNNRADDNLYFRIKKLRTYKGNIDEIADNFMKDIDLSNEYYEKARRAVLDKNYSYAIENARLSLMYNPHNKNAELLLLYADAVQKFDVKEYNAALSKLQELRAINPFFMNSVEMEKQITSMDFYDKQLSLIKELLNAGNARAAKKEADFFLQKYPDDKEGKELLVTIDAAVNRLEAERIYSEALDLFNKEQYEEAIKLTEAGVLLDKENNNLLSLQKQIEAKYGKIMALKYFERASRFILEKNYRQAKELLDTARKYDPGDEKIEEMYLKISFNEKVDRIKVIENEGDLLMNNKAYADAIVKYEEALQLDKENEILLKKTANARRMIMGQKVEKYIKAADEFINQEKYTEAEKVLAEGAKIDPENKEINDRLRRLAELRKLLGD